MGYHHVDPATHDSAPDRPSTKRSVSDACGLENLAAHVDEVAAGEAFVCEPESPQFASVPEDGEATTALVVGAPVVDDVHAYEP